MQQHVALAHGGEDIGALLQCRRAAGTERGELQIGPVDQFRDLHQAHQIHRPVDPVQVLRAELGLLQQELGHGLGAVVGDFQAHRRAQVALRQLALQRGAQVLHFLFVDEQVAVAGDAKLVAAAHAHAREHLGGMLVQHGGEKDEVLFLALARLARQLDHARQDARRLHDGGARGAAEGIAPLQFHGEIQALVEHARKGVRRIQADGREHGHHFVEEVIADPGALRFVEVVAAQEAHARFLQLGQDMFVEQPVLALDQLVRDAVDRGKDYARAHAVGPGGRQLGDADLEEFVQVAADDTQELQAFQQRHIRVLGLGQHAAVEFEDADFPVEEQCLGRGHLVFSLE